MKFGVWENDLVSIRSIITVKYGIGVTVRAGIRVVMV